ncbi:FAD-dependent oxidoreductase [Paenibacillus sp. LHD-38]|uniref:phytoene desaturase family protein n=1 Tax=Paenibacillus sp. LHD-38 TaxID=3072143 RepID=UPI00280F83D5|nr:FAD-dependent oxidoreductase [Paenibacillus sp. LHD-38]MDQ8737677.1 FAD-dependent oxidoreductase [Paenibacillus sp. LHD-38]
MIENHYEQTWDVVIIGAGIAGLTASIYLARAGQTVLLLDKGTQLGGRAASTEIAASRVNLGAHALYKSALPILQEVGVTPTGLMPKPTCTFVFKGTNGSNEALPLGQLLLGSFLKWHEKTQLLRFYSRLRKTDTSALHKVSLQAYLESQISSPRVRNVVLALVRVSTYCDAPDLLSAGAVIEQLKHGQVLYVDGGWQALVSQLTEQALQAGVSIRVSTPVREIAGSFPQMTVKLKDGTMLTTSHVLSTAGPADTLALLNPALSPTEAAVYEQMIPVRAACLDLVVTGMPEPKTKFVLGADYPWYYSNHSAFASLSDNQEYAVVHVMKYLSASTYSEPLQDERELEGFLDLIQPGWRKHIIRHRFLPRMIVSHAIVTAGNGGLSGRPGPAVEGRPGLYVAGDWVGSSGMLLNASLASAKEAARSIIAGKEQEKEGIHRGA